MTTSLSPVVFNAPLVNPAPTGLFSAVQWNEDDGPLRWLGPGVEVRLFNYGMESSFGVWQSDPFASESSLEETDVKLAGGHPEETDPFTHYTSWAADACDLTQGSQDEVLVRAQQVLRLNEQTAVEEMFSDRLLTDAGAIVDAGGVVGALATLEGLLAETNTLGVIHASAEIAAIAASEQLIRYSGSKMVTPLGHQWVFGGGYKTGLGDVLVASSPLFGWRGPVSVRSTIKSEWNLFYGLAERSLAVGYEVVLGAASVDVGSA